MRSSYVSETELPGRRIDSDTLEIIAHRYYWASNFVRGKAVLEVGCGPGLGLGWLSRHSRCTIGGDITEESIILAKRHYGRRAELVRLDAHRLPFKDHSVETVVCLAAIIYLDLPIFLDECRRVLTRGGTLAMNTPNKDQPGFHGSLLSRTYHSVPELHSLLQKRSFDAEFLGAFPIRPKLPANRSRSTSGFSIPSLRRWTGKTLKLLRLYGPMTRLGHSRTRQIVLTEELRQEEVNLSERVRLVPIPCNVPNREYRIIYVAAHPRS
jgi:SAM-dependent methyltransferase